MINARSWLVFSLFLLLGTSVRGESDEGQWIQLFNGKNLDGWKVKITGYELNENFGETFRVEDGLLKVSYDQYDAFRGRFGHLFYETPFSNHKSGRQPC